MKGLTVGDLMDFVNNLKSALYVEGLVQGNFTSTVSPFSISSFCV